MTSDDLTRSQAKFISESLFPGVNYLVRLKTQLEKSGFPGDDYLYKLVCEAYETSWRLSLEVHYMSCNGVGRPPRSD